MKALVGAFNQAKALVGAFSVITSLRMDVFKLYDQLGRDIVAAAKSVISDTRAASQLEEDIPRLKQEIADLRVQLSQFSQVIKKIDILLARK